MRSAVSAPLLSSPRWRSRAPFGKPVVPEVYWIMTGSSGLTAGSLMPSSSPAAMKASQSSKQMISRSSGQFARHRLHRLQHRVAAKTVDDEDAGRARLLQHIFHLPRAKRRVHGDEDHARHAGAEFEHHPFRDVLRPDGNALARLEARQQRAGGALGFAIELRVGPLTAQFWVGDARNQGQAIGRRLGRLAQEIAERHLPHRRRRRACDVRLRQCHQILPGPGTAPFLLPAFRSSPAAKMPFVAGQCKRTMTCEELCMPPVITFSPSRKAGERQWHANIRRRHRPTSNAQ